MKGSFLHTLIYAIVLGLLCTSLLTGVVLLTGPRKEANARAERMRGILDVLEVPYEPNTSSRELVELFNNSVRRELMGDLTVYAYPVSRGGASGRARAFEFAGPGLWGPIRGFLSLDWQMETIRKITFYEQRETPGLGGEIAAVCTCQTTIAQESCPGRFRHGLSGLKIKGRGGPGIRVVPPGTADAPNEVDAITGATMTCDKIESMLNTIIRKIVEERNEHGR